MAKFLFIFILSSLMIFPICVNGDSPPTYTYRNTKWGESIRQVKKKVKGLKKTKSNWYKTCLNKRIYLLKNPYDIYYYFEDNKLVYIYLQDFNLILYEKRYEEAEIRFNLLNRLLTEKYDNPSFSANDFLQDFTTVLVHPYVLRRWDLNGMIIRLSAEHAGSGMLEIGISYTSTELEDWADTRAQKRRDQKILPNL